MAVGDARNNLGESDKAGNIYYTLYYAATGKGSPMSDHGSFPYARKVLEAWSKYDNQLTLNRAHGMAHQTLMMSGCPYPGNT